MEFSQISGINLRKLESWSRKLSLSQCWNPLCLLPSCSYLVSTFSSISGGRGKGKSEHSLMHSCVTKVIYSNSYHLYMFILCPTSACLGTLIALILSSQQSSEILNSTGRSLSFVFVGVFCVFVFYSVSVCESETVTSPVISCWSSSHNSLLSFLRKQLKDPPSAYLAFQPELPLLLNKDSFPGYTIQM